MTAPFYTDTQQRKVSRILPDLVRSRELLVDLVWKEVRVRYRYALMGFTWAVLEPLALMLILVFVFTLVFRNRIPTSDTYKNFKFASVLLCGLIPWQFFANALTHGVRSIIENNNLVTKVHFPREVIPLAAVGNCLVNFLIGFAVLLVLLLGLEHHVGIGLVWCIGLMAIEVILATGLALILSILNVKFRDVGYMVGVAVVFGFYATPVFYTLDLVKQQLAGANPWLFRLYLLNPMAGLVECFRQALLLNQFPAWNYLWWPLTASLLLLVGGAILFRRMSPSISDYL